MAVLQFAFGSNSRNPHLPHNHEVDQVVYPGTHDNDTVVGWWKKASGTERHRVQRYLRMEEDDDVHWELIRCSIASVALTTIIPMQDILGLDNDARMNTPATQAGNWGWRVGESGIFSKLKVEQLKLRGLLDEFNRLPRGEKLVEEKADSKPKQLVVEEKADSKPKQLVVEEKQKSNPSKHEIK
jgi:4-alpha-glucanotransferase